MTSRSLPALIAAAVVLHATAALAQASAPMLVGCWSLHDGNKQVEENWTTAEGEVMLGLSRTVTGGRMTEYEFVVLRPKAGRLEYGVRLGDKPEVVFTSTTLNSTEVLFENAAHPFPKRIGYRLVGKDSLEAWIDGGAGGGPRVPYPYHRVACANP